MSPRLENLRYLRFLLFRKDITWARGRRPAFAEATARLEEEIDYLGASELTIFSKRGSPRSGSHIGFKRKLP